MYHCERPWTLWIPLLMDPELIFSLDRIGPVYAVISLEYNTLYHDLYTIPVYAKCILKMDALL